MAERQIDPARSRWHQRFLEFYGRERSDHIWNVITGRFQQTMEQVQEHPKTTAAVTAGVITVGTIVGIATALALRQPHSPDQKEISEEIPNQSPQSEKP